MLARIAESASEREVLRRTAQRLRDAGLLYGGLFSVEQHYTAPVRDEEYFQMKMGGKVYWEGWRPIWRRGDVKRKQDLPAVWRSHLGQTIVTTGLLQKRIRWATVADALVTATERSQQDLLATTIASANREGERLVHDATTYSQLFAMGVLRREAATWIREMAQQGAALIRAGR